MPEGAGSGRASRPAYGYGARILPAELHSKTENRELFWKEDAGDAKDFGKVMRPVLPHSAKEWNSENKRAKCCHVLPLLGIFFSPICARLLGYRPGFWILFWRSLGLHTSLKKFYCHFQKNSTCTPTAEPSLAHGPLRKESITEEKDIKSPVLKSICDRRYFVSIGVRANT